MLLLGVGVITFNFLPGEVLVTIFLTNRGHPDCPWLDVPDFVSLKRRTISFASTTNCGSLCREDDSNDEVTDEDEDDCVLLLLLMSGSTEVGEICQQFPAAED